MSFEEFTSPTFMYFSRHLLFSCFVRDKALWSPPYDTIYLLLMGLSMPIILPGY